MSKRWWLLGVLGLMLVGLLLACGSNYDSSTNGLLLVSSQGSGLIETFSFSLNTGHVSALSNPPADTSNQTCVLNGLPSSIVVDPAGSYAYTLINASPSCDTTTAKSKSGILAFKVNSDGTLTQSGSLIVPAQANVAIQGAAPPDNTELVDVVPFSLTVDSAGKFLFVADRGTTDIAQRSVPGSISVFAIGSSGSLTEVPGSPFFTITPAMTTVSTTPNDFVQVAATATVFPGIGINGTVNSVCQVPGTTPPTAEFLYAVDTLGYQVFEFQVDTSTGALTNPPGRTSIPVIAADQVPVGIAVDPCDRFVYVSNSETNKISAYKICIAVQSDSLCSVADGSLVPVAGSPFSLSGSANGPGPLVVDPYGNNVYVLDTLSNTVSPFKIAPISGALSPLSPATVATGSGPKSIAIRKDDNWLFVANFGSFGQGGSTVSQYQVTPATGALTVQPTIQTDTYPWGVAVK